MGKKGEERRVTQGGLTWEALLQCGDENLPCQKLGHRKATARGATRGFASRYR